MNRRRIKLRDRYETWHACDDCRDDWSVYRTHRGASACPNCDQMRLAHKVYDQHRDKLSFPLRRR